MKKELITLSLLSSLSLLAQTQNEPPVGTSPNLFTTTRPASASASVPAPQPGYGYSSFQQRLNSVVAAADAPEAPVICFQPMAQKNIDELSEDLQVLNLLLTRNLERAVSEKPVEVKLGVPMRMPMNSRSVRVSYLQDYGVNIRVNVPFAVAPAPGEKPKKKEPGAEESEWEKARRAVHGGEFDPSETSTDAPAYADELVGALKKELLEGLRHAKNLRHVKSDEWISLTVIGGNSGYSPRRASILAMRIKKSAAEKSKSIEDLEKEAQINAYMDPSVGNETQMTVRRIPTVPKAQIGR
jgi:hypothetical protein